MVGATRHFFYEKRKTVLHVQWSYIERDEKRVVLLDDVVVFKRAVGGDNEAFVSLLAPYHGKIYRTAFAYLKNEPDALDAVQEVAIKAYKNLRKIKKPEALTAWLTRITINYCLTEIKKGKRVMPVADVELSPDHQRKTDSLQPLMMQEAIETLPRDLQVIIFLKYYDGFTLEEIAGQMRKPVGTIKTMLHRALVALREEVGRRD
jgi:RNA polymerase sigma factor (sigma-70 family)